MPNMIFRRIRRRSSKRITYAQQPMHNFENQKRFDKANKNNNEQGENND